jgi:hypothetical protein
MDSVGKYSVQNWGIYRLESGLQTPPPGGCFLIVYVYDTIDGLIHYVIYITV